MVEEFIAYASNYSKNKDSVVRKIEHSLRVYEMMMKLAFELGFEEEEVELAGFIGLVHDIGYFDIIKMDDATKLDHADYSVKVLFEDNLITKFRVDHKYYKVVEYAIQNHNKYELETTSDENEMKFSKLLRDVDKIDILYQFSTPDEQDIVVDESTIKDVVWKSFNSQKCIKGEFVETNNERVVATLALVFDINYRISLQFVKKYIPIIYERIKGNRVFDEAYKKINEYLEERDDVLC